MTAAAAAAVVFAVLFSASVAEAEGEWKDYHFQPYRCDGMKVVLAMCVCVCGSFIIRGGTDGGG